MRRVLLYGAIGGLPGLLIAVVPLLLHEAGVITSDQSQIGFIGVPLLFIGVVIGITMGVPDSPQRGKAMLGMILGGLLGVVATAATSANGVGGPWFLLLGPIGLIGGAMLGLRLGHHGTGPGRPAAHH